METQVYGEGFYKYSKVSVFFVHVREQLSAFLEVTVR